MKTYIMAFIFYTLAMIGVLFAGFIVYKKTMITTCNRKKGSMKILESLPISPKKMLLIVKVENRKFLIASDMDNTTFLADLTKENLNEQKEESANAPIEKFENNVIFEKENLNNLKEGSSRKKMIRKILQNFKSSDLSNRSGF